MQMLWPWNVTSDSYSRLCRSSCHCLRTSNVLWGWKCNIYRHGLYIKRPTCKTMWRNAHKSISRRREGIEPENTESGFPLSLFVRATNLLTSPRSSSVATGTYRWEHHRLPHVPVLTTGGHGVSHRLILGRDVYTIANQWEYYWLGRMEKVRISRLLTTTKTGAGLLSATNKSEKGHS